MKITPVLVVPSIESVLPLYEALGFARKVEVPHGDVLGFVTLEQGAAEVMLQTVESVRADAASVLEGPVKIGASSLFIEVPNLDEHVGAGGDLRHHFVERRTTFYGATETFLRDAAGNVIILAQF